MLNRLLTLATFALLLAACSTGPEKSRSTAQPRVAPEVGTPYVTEISFAKNKASLPFPEQKRIDNVVEMANLDSKPDRVIVIAWPDHKEEKRTKEAIQLVHDRALVVKQLIREKFKDIPVETISMVTQSGELDRLLSSSETKKALEFAGVQKDSTDDSKASKTIVMVIPKKSSR